MENNLPRKMGKEKVKCLRVLVCRDVKVNWRTNQQHAAFEFSGIKVAVRAWDLLDSPRPRWTCRAKQQQTCLLCDNHPGGAWTYPIYSISEIRNFLAHSFIFVFVVVACLQWANRTSLELVVALVTPVHGSPPLGLYRFKVAEIPDLQIR